MEIEIIPAIMPHSLTDLEQKLALVVGAAPIVQIDLMDGQFVDAQTWPYNRLQQERYQRILSEEEGMPYWEEIAFEFDLMVADAVEQIDTLVKLGPKRIIFHEKANPNLLSFLQTCDPFLKDFFEIGAAFGCDTEIETIEPFISEIAFVQIMGIETIGKQGESFDERTLTLVKNLHSKYPDLPISVDGGVSLSTAKMLVDAGATRLVSGSAIFQNGDPATAIQEFKNLLY